MPKFRPFPCWLALPLLLACEPAARPAPPGPASESRLAARTSERVQVAYPAGDCTTGHIEVQVYEDGLWRLHPEHPLVGADARQWEAAESLLSLRVRCIDPEGRRPPSPWVTGVRVGDGGKAAGQAAGEGPRPRAREGP